MTLSELLSISPRDLRLFRQDTLPLVMGVVIASALSAALLFYLIRGRIRISRGRSGKRIRRFSVLERCAHWTLALSLLILAVTGLNKAVGRQVVQPLLAPDVYATWTRLARMTHEYTSFAFAAALLAIIILWVRDTRPARVDLAWLAAGGGLVGTAHPSAGRFNAGQKIVFWLVALGGTLMAATGFNMMYPDVVLAGGALRAAIIVHGICAALLIGLTIGHIYIGSIGIEGAAGSMIRGDVDENWARQHHDLWARTMSAGDHPSPPEISHREGVRESSV